MSAKHEYWFEMAEYDLETARAMLTTRRVLYVGFMCQQTIEKALKGLFVHVNPDVSVPYIHGVAKLAKYANVYEVMSDHQKGILDVLEPMNIEARYPSVKDKLLASLTVSRCEEIIRETEALMIWIKSKLLK